MRDWDLNNLTQPGASDPFDSSAWAPRVWDGSRRAARLEPEGSMFSPQRRAVRRAASASSSFIPQRYHEGFGEARSPVVTNVRCGARTGGPLGRLGRQDHCC